MSQPVQIIPAPLKDRPLTFKPAGRGKPPLHFADLTAEQRLEVIQSLNQPKFRLKQLAQHYYVRNSITSEEMTDLPLEARAGIIEALFPQLLQNMRDKHADKGKTIKSLWKLFDGAKVESVLMRYPSRSTLCISSQAGCGMACPFCATGQLGLTRNLSVAEIVEQVRYANWLLQTGQVPGGETRLNNIVFMGLGEPMANYKTIMAAIRQFTAPTPNGFGISARQVTVSTVGLVPAINKMADEGLPLRLALSLHAPDDELRNKLVPINTRWSVDEVLDAARAYFEKTGRRVSIEYALIKDMNDHEWRAALLGKKLNSRGRGWVHINPIPLNPTPGSIWTASDPDVEETIVETLRAAGIPTTIRDTRGSDIDGACGQLAAEES